MTHEAGIPLLSISRITVHGWCYITHLFKFFFPRERCTCNNFCFIHFSNFFSATLFSIFTLCDFCFLIKHGFLNVFPFYVDISCFYLNTFYSILVFLYFHTIINFDSHYHHYCYDYCYYYCCYYYFHHFYCHYYFFIFNAFNFYYSCFYYSISYL